MATKFRIDELLKLGMSKETAFAIAGAVDGFNSLDLDTSTMKSSYPKLFEPTPLMVSVQGLFTLASTPVTTTLRGGRVRFTNATATAQTVTVYAVPAGATVDGGNVLLNEVSIAANDYLDTDIPQMKAGDSLMAGAGADDAVVAHFLIGTIYT